MTAYRKKPVVIEATQWCRHGDHAAVVAIPADHPIDKNAIDPTMFGWVPTLEGGHVVTPGDWIITGVKGEHYPCKPDIFEATYEPATHPQPPAPQAEAAEPTERALHPSWYAAPQPSQPEAEAQPFTYEGSHIAADGTVTYVSGEAYQPPQRQEAAQVEAAIEDGEFEPGQWTQSAQWAIQQNPGGTLRIIAQLKRQLAEALASSRVAAPTMQAVKVPLTEGQIERGRQDHGGERHDFTAGVRYAESFHGIQPSEGERSHD